MQARTISIAALLLNAAAAAIAGQTSTGATPLSDMLPGQTYQGFEGGLYPGSSSTPPPAHLAAAAILAQQVAPLNALGQRSLDGVVVMLSIGMSNTTHEFAVFERQEDANTDRNARLVLINGGLGGQDAATIQNPTAPYWTNVNERLFAMGLTPEQVQVVWLKEANANPPDNFPIHAQQLQADLAQVARNLHDKFPNLKICYISNRTYGGYATTTLNPEPQAYETGFADKWVIEQQINGDPALNFNPDAGDVVAPLLLWGPDLWADGLVPRSDGLIWEQSDFESDGTHPSPSGEQKVANLLSGFFGSDLTADAWFSRSPRVVLLSANAIEDASVLSGSPNANFGADPDLLFGGSDSLARTYLQFPGVNPIGTVLWAKLSLRVPTSSIAIPSQTHRVDDIAWEEETITFANAPGAVGEALATNPTVSRDGTFAANAMSQVNAPTAQLGLSFVISPDSATGGPTGALESKEAVAGAFPPRLVFAVALPSPDINGDGVVDTADLGILISLFGSSNPIADLNGDGVVDTADLGILIAFFGQTIPG